MEQEHSKGILTSPNGPSIVRMVFEAILDENSFVYRDTAIALSAVNRMWQTPAEETPCLWVDIDLGKKGLLESVGRSKKHPVHIKQLHDDDPHF